MNTFVSTFKDDKIKVMVCADSHVSIYINEDICVRLTIEALANNMNASEGLRMFLEGLRDGIEAPAGNERG